MVELRKAPKINLSKGKTVCLTKDGDVNSKSLDKIYFGVSWKNKTLDDADIDASLFLFNSDGNLIETVYYGHKISNNSSIRHSGDDLVGGNTALADNETIEINLSKVDSDIKYIAASINVYRGPDFGSLEYITSRIYTGSLGNPDEVLFEYKLDDKWNGKKSVIVGIFEKKDKWEYKAAFYPGKCTRISSLQWDAQKALHTPVLKEDIPATNETSITNRIKNFLNKIF